MAWVQGVTGIGPGDEIARRDLPNYVDFCEFGSIETQLSHMPSVYRGMLFDADMFEEWLIPAWRASSIDLALAVVRGQVHDDARTIRFFMTKSDATYAFAYSSLGKHYVGVSDMMIYQIDKFTKRVAEKLYPTLWRDGQAFSSEAEAVRPRNEAISSILELGPSSQVSNDLSEEELNFANNLSTLTIKFIAFHELVHIVNGHTQLDLPKVNDPTNPAQLFARQLTKRTLEFDADIGAAQWLFRWILELKNRGASSPLIESSSSIILSTLAATYLALTALDGMSPVRTVADLAVMSHPPAQFRATYAIRGLDAYIQREIEGGNPMPMPTEQQISAVITSIESAIKELGRGAYDEKYYMEWDGRFNLELEAVRSRWARIRPMLERFKLGTHKLALPHRSPDEDIYF